MKRYDTGWPQYHDTPFNHAFELGVLHILFRDDFFILTKEINHFKNCVIINQRPMPQNYLKSTINTQNNNEVDVKRHKIVMKL